MEVRGEEEREADVAKGGAGGRRIVIDPDAQGIEDVR
jgi:hypothetical protein